MPNLWKLQNWFYFLLVMIANILQVLLRLLMVVCVRNTKRITILCLLQTSVNKKRISIRGTYLKKMNVFCLIDSTPIQQMRFEKNK